VREGQVRFFPVDTHLSIHVTFTYGNSFEGHRLQPVGTPPLFGIIYRIGAGKKILLRFYTNPEWSGKTKEGGKKV
jgi:hypothetical protein